MSASIDYLKRKERARQQAVDWQQWAEGWNMSYSELARFQDHFTKLARRYGLVTEFRENGII